MLRHSCARWRVRCIVSISYQPDISRNTCSRVFILHLRIHATTIYSPSPRDAILHQLTEAAVKPFKTFFEAYPNKQQQLTSPCSAFCSLNCNYLQCWHLKKFKCHCSVTSVVSSTINCSAKQPKLLRLHCNAKQAKHSQRMFAASFGRDLYNKSRNIEAPSSHKDAGLLKKSS